MVALTSTVVHSEHSPTNLTDERQDLIRSYVEVQTETESRQRADLRAVLNGLRSKLKRGCWWGLLPRLFPPKSTVRSSLQKWVEKGTLVKINDVLRLRVWGDAEERERVETTGGVIDV
ncbi:transposase [Roseiflexus castenholzii]|jgi:transposase|uniref:transposase n=1 Tax=Roseiflexus castenholzii TaxID=120962 RepID=UPI0003021BE0|nr:transposase [Roseiflexus castenholzii]